MVSRNGKRYVCELDWAMDLIRGKWKAVILCHLNDGPKRLLELQRITVGISQKVLYEKLQELEEAGLIFKTVFPEVPPRVEFTLTDAGKDLFPALAELQAWARRQLAL